MLVPKEPHTAESYPPDPSGCKVHVCHSIHWEEKSDSNTIMQVTTAPIAHMHHYAISSRLTTRKEEDDSNEEENEPPDHVQRGWENETHQEQKADL